MKYKEVVGVITIKGKYTRIYLRKCRWCKKEFFDHQPNKLYCSAQHQYWALRNNKNKYDRNYYRKKKKELILQRKGTVDLKKRENQPVTYLGVNIPGSEWVDEILEVEKLKKQTFSGTIYRGKKKDPQTEGSSPSHQYITLDDLYHFSISYLKEKNIKCQECGSRTNEITHGLVICRRCGIILRAPPVHPGYIVDDTLPKWKVAPTVQDISQTNTSKEAHELAFSQYWEQVGILDPELYPENPLPQCDRDDWETAWKYYKKKRLKQKSIKSFS